MKVFKKRLKAMWFGEDPHEEVPIEIEDIEVAISLGSTAALNEVGMAIPIEPGVMPKIIFNKRSSYE